MGLILIKIYLLPCCKIILHKNKIICITFIKLIYKGAIMHISLQIIIAALTVLGLYLCFKTLASLIFTSRQITSAIIIENKEQLLDIDLLIPEAEDALLFKRRRGAAVIIPENIWKTCSKKERSFAIESANSFGARLYFCETIDL